MKTGELTELVLTDKGRWMPCPKMELNHPGLAYFCPLEQLIVAAKRDPLHEIIGSADVCYTIFNTDGEKVFIAVQEKKCRKYNLKVYNLYGNQVIHLKKRFKFCYNKANFWAPAGNFLGSVEEVLTRVTRLSCSKTFVVKNALAKAVLKIRRRKIPFQYDYEVFSDDEKVGTVSNRWRFRNILNVKSFGVSFPLFMSVEYKVMMLCACFFIGCLKF